MKIFYESEESAALGLGAQKAENGVREKFLLGFDRPDSNQLSGLEGNRLTSVLQLINFLCKQKRICGVNAVGLGFVMDVGQEFGHFVERFGVTKRLGTTGRYKVVVDKTLWDRFVGRGDKFCFLNRC